VTFFASLPAVYHYRRPSLFAILGSVMNRTACICIFLGAGLTLFLAGCQLSAPAPEPTLVPAAGDDPYRASLLSQGFVELVDDNITPRELTDDSSQAERGSETYRQVCLACHGDWGQGLTDEWRAEWGEDSNCWQSRCHGPNHPPWGFSHPRYVPPVLGPTGLTTFHSAAELQQSIVQSMPWWLPGSLTDEQAWELTAYLMGQRGELADDVILNEGNAAIYQLRIPYVPTTDYRPGTVLLIGLLILAAVTLLRQRH
jgi:mono/diheme cytochrome c family protein